MRERERLHGTAKMGRPTKYSEEMVEKICELIADGASLRKICERKDMPDRSQVARWLDLHPEFRDQYARAREAQADKIFEEITTIADAATPETVHVARLRVDSRKFVVARLAPKKYGDRILTEQQQLDAEGKPVTPTFTVNVGPYPEPPPAPETASRAKDTRH